MSLARARVCWINYLTLVGRVYFVSNRRGRAAYPLPKIRASSVALSPLALQPASAPAGTAVYVEDSATKNIGVFPPFRRSGVEECSTF